MSATPEVGVTGGCEPSGMSAGPFVRAGSNLQPQDRF